MKKISIVIINYNGGDDTLECLESLSKVKQEGFDLSILIIDNASSEVFKMDKSPLESDQPWAEKFKINVEIIRTEENLGFSGGNNLGIKKAIVEGADYVLLLNNDTRVDPHFLKNMVKGFERHQNVGIVVPKIYFEKGYEFHKKRYKENEKGKVIWYAGGKMDWRNVYGYHKGVDKVDNGEFDNDEITEYATGCCMLVKKEVFEKIGYLDNRYFLYYEDNDFSMRAKKASFFLYFIPSAIIWHKNAGSTGGSGSTLQDYFISRNRLLFGFSYASVKTKISLIRESLRILTAGRKWQKKGVIDFYFHRFGKGSYENNLKVSVKG